MLTAFLWGLAANSSLLLGGILGLSLTFGNRTMGIIMAFGAGTLISAVSYELMLDAVKIAQGTGVTHSHFLRALRYFLPATN